MSQKSAALESKFEIAVKTLLKAPNLTVPEAMLVAKFLPKDIENKSMQKIIVRGILGGKRAMAAFLRSASLPPSIVDVPQCYSPQISNLTTLTGGGRVDTAIAGRIQPPKLKQQRMTASALQRKRIERKPSNHAGLCDRCCRRHCRHRHQNRPPSPQKIN